MKTSCCNRCFELKASHHFGTGTFWQVHVSAPADIPAHGHFVSMDIWTQGLFGMGTFWHKELSGPWTFQHRIFRLLNILAHGYFSTLQSNMDVSAQPFWHLCYCAKNVHLPKCHCAEMSMVPKNPCAKKSR